MEGLGLNWKELRVGGPELVLWGIAGDWVVTRVSSPCLKNDIAKGQKAISIAIAFALWKPP